MKSRLSIAMFIVLFSIMLLSGFALISRRFVAMSFDQAQSLETADEDGSSSEVKKYQNTEARVVASYDQMLEFYCPLALALVCVGGYFVSGIVLNPIERRLKDLQRFTTDAGHELRTPIAIALSNVQAMQLDLEQKLEVQPRRIETTERAILRMKKLVEDLFLLARSDDAHALSASEQKVDLADLIPEIAEQYDRPFSAKSVVLLRSVEHCSVMSDPELLSRALENLLENALHYTAPGGRVDISVHRRDAAALLVVSDTGVGIAKELNARVFERFFRVDESRDRHKGGAGLGLSIVKSIVESLGGTVWLESELGKGCTFYLQLPLLE